MKLLLAFSTFALLFNIIESEQIDCMAMFVTTYFYLQYLKLLWTHFFPVQQRNNFAVETFCPSCVKTARPQVVDSHACWIAQHLRSLIEVSCYWLFSVNILEYKIYLQTLLSLPLASSLASGWTTTARKRMRIKWLNAAAAHLRAACWRSAWLSAVIASFKQSAHLALGRAESRINQWCGDHFPFQWWFFHMIAILKEKI